MYQETWCAKKDKNITANSQKYLWSSIVRTPTAGLQKMAIMHDIAQTKVSKFYIIL